MSALSLHISVTYCDLSKKKLHLNLYKKQLQTSEVKFKGKKALYPVVILLIAI